MAIEGRLRRVLRLAVAHPIATLALVCLLQVLPTLGSRDYWAFDEVRHADVLRNVLEQGDWFSLHLNGAPYPDKPPVYFWLVAAVARLVGTDGPVAFFLVSGLGGFLFLVATWGFARATIATRAPATALLAPLMVSVTPLFQVLLRTTRMDLLFGALVTAGLTCLWKGLGPTASRRMTVLGFAFAGLATLVKGPAGLALPLASAVPYLLWSGQARRLVRADVFAGLALAGALIAGWALGLAVVEGWDYLHELLRGQVFGRTLLAHQHTRSFLYYLLLLPLACLPWTALLAALPWPRLARPVAAPRRTALAWVAWTLLGGLLVLSLVSTKLFIYLLPLLAPLSVLGARSVRGLDGRGRHRLWTATGTLLLAAAAAFAALEPLMAWGLALDDFALRGTGLAAAALAVTGLGILLLRRRPSVAPWAVTVGGLLVSYLVLAIEVAPSLDPIMSPRRQAEVVAEYAVRGYEPLAFRVYPGTYSYYARQAVPEAGDLAGLHSHLGRRGPILIALARKYWERHADGLVAFRLVHEQRIEGRPFVVAVRSDETEGD